MNETAAPELWHDPMPRHFDLRVAWWVKVLVLALLTVGAVYFVDVPVTQWARAHAIPDLMQDGAAKGGDRGRELMWLEQFGQFVCSVVVILAVFFLDPKGRRRALAVGIACLATLAVTHLSKDLVGRSRPFVAAADGTSEWRGPWWGFHGGARFGSFPSAHTTGAFALAAALAWCYPRGRCFFMTLATITAMQRILHTAHYVSDVIAGLAVGVTTARATLHAKLAGRVLAAMPDGMRNWWMAEKTQG